MKKRKVVSAKNLPYRSPFAFSLLGWLVLERLSAPGWLMGFFAAVALVFFVAWLVDFLTHEDRDIFKND